MKRGTLLKRIERLKVKPDQELGGEQGGGMDPGSGAGVTQEADSLVPSSDRPARIDRAGLPAYVQHPAARWESGYPSDCKSAYTGSNPVRASNKTNGLWKVG